MRNSAISMEATACTMQRFKILFTIKKIGKIYYLRHPNNCVPIQSQFSLVVFQ
jgi:hypothetical protein